MWSDSEGEGVDKESIGIGMLYSTRTYEFLAGVQSMASAPPEATGRHLPDHTTAGPCAKPATAPFSPSIRKSFGQPSKKFYGIKALAEQAPDPVV
ncbi:hypothetical protein MRB53_036590 [Persea americana]|nr:hypothetical protein MRB53_036728 [Persea americana]KAJ8614392.1 hypothetical protein MRB53_036590 [Persea americana]